MWAQLIKVPVKPGKDVAGLSQALRDAEQPGSGLVRRLTMRDQKDPHTLYTMIVVESEEKARARERDPRREGLQGLQARLADALEGPPEFIDLEIVDEVTS